MFRGAKGRIYSAEGVGGGNVSSEGACNFGRAKRTDFGGIEVAPRRPAPAAPRQRGSGRSMCMNDDGLPADQRRRPESGQQQQCPPEEQEQEHGAQQPQCRHLQYKSEEQKHSRKTNTVTTKVSA